MDTLAILRFFLRHTLSSVILLLLGLAGPAFAGNVQLAWDANTETDLAGYLVLVGTSSGVYTHSVEIGPNTPQGEVSNLADGATYYFAVRAFNAAGLQSGLSNEVSVTLGTVLANPPAITAVSPTSALSAGGTLVTVTGAHFTQGAVVRFGATPATVQSVSATSIVVLTPALDVGAFPVSVTLLDGQSATASGSFTVLAPTPVVQTLTPSAAPTTGGTAVTISGGQFMAGASVLFGSQPALVTAVTSTSIAVLSPVQAAGPVNVTVVNPGGALATKLNAFTFVAPALEVTGVSPLTGPALGGNTVVVSGQGFGPDSVVLFGGTTAQVVAVNATALSVLVPTGAAGPVALTVRNADGLSSTKADAYTYTSAAPVLNGLSPVRGPEEGGTVVTLSGAHFVAGVSVTFGGRPAVVSTVSDTQIVVTTPMHSAGAADVTVQNPDGLTTTRGQGFSYDAPASPTFVRYFAEGVQSQFFSTRFALANPHAAPVAVHVTFTDSFGNESPMTVDVPANGRATVDRSTMPVIAGDAFATTFESEHEIAVDRTVTWDAGTPYGGHSETGIEAPRTTWYFAEGATHSGFSLFYLLQNPGDETAEVLVRYMLTTGQVIDKVHYVAARARTNIWVNQDDPALASAEVSAQLRSLNGVPFVVERSMYQSVNRQLFTSGTNSAAVAEPSTRWFLAEGATGDYFDTFVLVSNPNPTAATLQVTYLMPQGSPLQIAYTVPANSRFTIWLDQEHNRLKKTDVSVIVTATNGVPVVVERTMWWPGSAGGAWTEAHSSAGSTTSAARWVMADGLSSTVNGTVTYALVANTASARTQVRFTLLTPQGRGRSVQAAVSGKSRYSIDVATTFPEARDTRFSLLIESLDGAPLVVERSTYWDAGGTRWAGGTNGPAMPLR